MSLLNLFCKKSKIECFTTPSHGSKFFILNKFKQFYKWDISETDCYNPQAALDLAQKKAAKIYGVKSTYFLTNGSSSGIMAAVLACVKKNDKVLIWDEAHICHKNSVELAGAEPVFYSVEKDGEFGVDLQVTPEVVESALAREKVSAVIVTSPTYEGIVSDIQAIAQICKSYGTCLIVDEAHGALYPFCEELPTSAIYLGADFVVQSLHKTAGGLNPTALLHSNLDCQLDLSLQKITTTSPSYPLLTSIEANINYLNSQRGRNKIANLVYNIEQMKTSLPECDFFGDDPTKIIVKAHNLKNIEDEISNEKSSMFLCGLGTDTKKLKKLQHALSKNSQKV